MPANYIPRWSQPSPHALYVDNLNIDGLLIDGMDIDCCRNVRIANCAVNSRWDDATVPKSSYAPGYARATENL